jgi:hypothetical protein
VSDLVNGQQIFMSDLNGNKVIAAIQTDTISRVRNSAGSIILTFPTFNNFDKFKVGEGVQGGSSPVYATTSDWSETYAQSQSNPVTLVGGSAYSVTGSSTYWFSAESASGPIRIKAADGSGTLYINGFDTTDKSGGQGTNIYNSADPITLDFTLYKYYQVYAGGNGAATLQLDSVSITAIDYSGPSITTYGGSWYGSDGSGDPNGQTALGKEQSGSGSVQVAIDGNIILREDNKEWVDGFYATAPEQRIAARKVGIAAVKRKKSETN